MLLTRKLQFKSQKHKDGPPNQFLENELGYEKWTFRLIQFFRV
jgi:hypothetical protein